MTTSTSGEGIPGCSVGTGSCPCGTIGCPCATDDSCPDEGSACGANGYCIRELAGMLHVPEGEFHQGCIEGHDDILVPCSDAGEAWEIPYKVVWVSGFWIDRLETTTAEYLLCVDAGACELPYGWEDVFSRGLDDWPMRGMRWTLAQRYCEWMGKRLPTDAEWEKAARGWDRRTYPWGDDPPECKHAYAMPCSHGGSEPQSVGLLPEGMSPFGALDMLGNASEWVDDWWNDDWYRDRPTRDPHNVGPPEAEWAPEKSLRSSSYGSVRERLRVSRRVPNVYDEPDQYYYAHGVRCASADPP